MHQQQEQHERHLSTECVHFSPPRTRAPLRVAPRRPLPEPTLSQSTWEEWDRAVEALDAIVGEGANSVGPTP